MVIPARVELATYSLGNCCSFQLSHKHIVDVENVKHKVRVELTRAFRPRGFADLPLRPLGYLREIHSLS